MKYIESTRQYSEVIEMNKVKGILVRQLDRLSEASKNEKSVETLMELTGMMISLARQIEEPETNYFSVGGGGGGGGGGSC